MEEAAALVCLQRRLHSSSEAVSYVVVGGGIGCRRRWWRWVSRSWLWSSEAGALFVGEAASVFGGGGGIGLRQRRLHSLEEAATLVVFGGGFICWRK